MIIFIISLFFIILVIFWRMQKFICFSLTRAILYSCNLLCYNEGSGHVLMWGMISKDNYESAILWRHARRSYFRRFHWISESFLFHSGGVSSPLQGDGAMRHGPKCCCRAVYCPWMDLSMVGRPLLRVQTNHLSSLRTGLFYKAREFEWANFAHMRQPTPPPNVCTIGINCFALFYWIHA